MSKHAFFSPSAAHRWINCPGSMAYPENSGSHESSTFADDGTASHTWAAECLKRNIDAEAQIGEKIKLNDVDYEMDDERASFVQVYVDDVRRRAMGGELFVEQQIDLSEYFGEGQMGTSDAVIIQPRHKLLVVEDLKYGTGEKVYAKNNAQGLCYALGALQIAELYCEIERIQIVICQPRLGHIDEWELTIPELHEFVSVAQAAVAEVHQAIIMPESGLAPYLRPGEKTCRWCRVKARCPALAAFVQESVKSDFETIAAQPPLAPVDLGKLQEAMGAVPLIEDWCRAVRGEVYKHVQAGDTVLGTDGLPYKFVEGKKGNRAWIDEKQAEAALLGRLTADQAYKPQEIITASAAAKILDKKKTKAIWNEVFVPLISRAPGKAMLVLGSDERPPFSGAATADDFTDPLEE